MEAHKRKAVAVLAILLLEDDIDEKQRKKPRYWIKPWIARRLEFGCHNNLLNELRLEDEHSYRRYLRMDEDTFTFLLQLVRSRITKKNTNWREAISASEKLSITLRLLATGESQWSMSTQFRVGQSTISKFLAEVSKAIYDGLRNEYLKTPNNADEWKKIAAGFESMWNFPQCIGAVDGKHVNIKCPPKSGSLYFNYKGYFSLVLMAVVDANLKFIYVDVGTPGRMSDGGTWDKCSLNQKLEEKSLFIPPHERSLLMKKSLPFVFVGDEAFPLKENIMRPYSSLSLNDEKRIFNYRLSRARRTSENAFGILANTWRILHTPIAMKPEKVEYLVLAICALHNLLLSRKSARSILLPPGSIDQEDIATGNVVLGDWMNDDRNVLNPIQRLPPQRFLQNSMQIRDEYKEYFNGPGLVPWQYNFALGV